MRKRIFKSGKFLKLVVLFHTVEFIVGNFSRGYTFTRYTILRDKGEIYMNSKVYLPDRQTHRFSEHERMHLITNEWYLKHYYYETPEVIETQLKKLHSIIDGCN